jgi:hypothetical protein
MTTEMTTVQVEWMDHAGTGDDGFAVTMSLSLKMSDDDVALFRAAVIKSLPVRCARLCCSHAPFCDCAPAALCTHATHVHHHVHAALKGGKEV